MSASSPSSLPPWYVGAHEARSSLLTRIVWLGYSCMILITWMLWRKSRFLHSIWNSPGTQNEYSISSSSLNPKSAAKSIWGGKSTSRNTALYFFCRVVTYVAYEKYPSFPRLGLFPNFLFMYLLLPMTKTYDFHDYQPWMLQIRSQFTEATRNIYFNFARQTVWNETCLCVCVPRPMMRISFLKFEITIGLLHQTANKSDNLFQMRPTYTCSTRAVASHNIVPWHSMFAPANHVNPFFILRTDDDPFPSVLETECSHLLGWGISAVPWGLGHTIAFRARNYWGVLKCSSEMPRLLAGGIHLSFTTW